jgi:photosystem II stability/assembly factor-like uncharacterized protein
MMRYLRLPRRLFLGLTVLALCLAAAPASADRWQPLPLWGGNAWLVASESDPSIVYAATRHAGIYRSSNRGQTWQLAGFGPGLFPAQFLDVDPHDADRLYLRVFDPRSGFHQGLFRSDDAGRSWQRADAGLRFHVSTLAFDRRTPGVVYAGTLRGLYRSRNAGRTWRLVALEGKLVIRIGISPTDSNVLLVSAADEGWTTQRSTDGGRTFTKVFDDSMETFVFDPAWPQRVYASKFSDFYQSDDLGATWAHRTAPDTILSLKLTRSGLLLLGGFAGVRRSLDGGVTWEPAEGPAPPPDSIGSLVELDDRILASGFRDIWRSRPQGRAWRPSSTGFRGHWVQELEVGGGADPTLWVSTEAALFKSRDEGASFQSLLDGLGPYNPSAYVTLLAADPQRPEVAYLFGCCARLSDRPFDFGLLKTEDGGATWDRLPYTGALRDVMVLEVNPGSPDIVYAGGFFEPHGGPCTAVRSTDGGETWECMLPLANRDFWDLAIDPRNPRLLYALAGEALFRSADRGASWAQVPTRRTGLRQIEADPDDGGRTWTRKLAIQQPLVFRNLLPDPVRRDRIWATADAFAPGLASQETSRIFRSDDAGGRWTEVKAGLKPGTVILDLAADPESGAIYAGTAGRGLFRLNQAGL